MIAWVYGSGFPKSLNVGKAVDEKLGNDREVVGEKKLWGHNAGSGAASFSKNKFEGQTGVTRTEPLTKGLSMWEGWGTALKPALEPITVARKPLVGTVAENVLEWSTGAINVDGCRVATEEEISNHSRSAESAQSKGKYGDSKEQETHQTDGQKLGRWPANFIHDGSEGVVNQFPINAGAAAPVKRGQNGDSSGVYGDYAQKGDDGRSFYGDKGSAARFFYCAKASKRDRDEGCEAMEEKNGFSGKQVTGQVGALQA